ADLGSSCGHVGLAHVKVGRNFLHVVVVLKRLHQLHHLAGLRSFEFDVVMPADLIAFCTASKLSGAVMISKLSSSSRKSSAPASMTMSNNSSSGFAVFSTTM